MLHQLVLTIHVLAVVFVVGFGLYGVIFALGGTEDPLIERAFRSRWPAPGLPGPFSLSVSAIGTWSLLIASVTGFLLLGTERADAARYLPKLAAVGVTFVLQLTLFLRPRRVILLAHFLVLLTTVALAVALAR